MNTLSWEQRRLGEIADRCYGGGTPSTSNPSFWNGNIPWIQSSDISEDDIQKVYLKNYISTMAILHSPAKIIPANSIAITTRVGFGKIAHVSYSYTTSQDFLSLSGINENIIFLTYAIYRKLQKDKNLVQGTSIKGITKNELLNKCIEKPTQSEQSLIGEFFRRFDNLLTLHQRKGPDNRKFYNVLCESMQRGKGRMQYAPTDCVFCVNDRESTRSEQFLGF